MGLKNYKVVKYNSDNLNFLFFTYANIKHKEIIPLPDNFDLIRHKENYPPYEYGFPKGVNFHDYKVYCFLFLISSIPARNTDLINNNGYTPIVIGKVENNIKDISLYVNYLERTGIIDIDKQYIVGEKARGYRWSNYYSSRPFVSKQVITRFADDVYQSQINTNKDQYPYIYHWYDEKLLNINPIAELYAYVVKQQKMNDKSKKLWDWNSNLDRLKSPIAQYQAIIRNIGKTKLGEYEAHFDNNVHRLHSTLTNLQKEYRNFLHYNNSKLTSVDIKNSQPYLTCLILNPDFWSPNSTIPLNIGHLPDNVQGLFLGSEKLMKALTTFFKKVCSDDFVQYKELVSNGGIYEHIKDLANNYRRTEETFIDRKEAKTMMFSLLFSKNRGRTKNARIGKMKRLFNSRLFPPIGRLFRLLKADYSDMPSKKPHARLPILLQAIESEVILHRCCRKIWNEKEGQIPIFTIHDSIASTSEYIPYIKDVMKQELCSCIGVSPNFSIEEWNEENLDKDIIAQIKTNSVDNR
ncbi:hypothetical protein [Odoribacter laneus]|uniref:Uncharacterized protein n=1 Tax=Odoribacter laneus YIT 12061 TaxID=742817 RepID=H1DDA0_9BACT|nr:hypothetical protein [Odoribacter laneus]EHP50909.1 hypothetical protein HMPREF9449_00236 [Odoribacter laneus YIT 12061]